MDRNKMAQRANKANVAAAPGGMPSTDAGYDVPALRRAGDVLDLLATRAGPVSAGDLMQLTGISKSTLYLLLDTLERRKWVERRSEGYVVGVRLFEIGAAYLRHDRLQEAFRAEAAPFVAQHNEVAQLAILEGAQVVYVAREDAMRPVRLVSDLGTRLSAHSCALGKALLASLDDAAVTALLPAILPAQTPRTVTRLPQLLKQLAEVRRSGLARDVEEVSAGLHCFAAYVGMTALGRRVAVSTSVPVDRLTRQRERELTVAVVELAQRLARRIVPRH
jgi:DNA-binding IclR family transcriptional regulator